MNLLAKLLWWAKGQRPIELIRSLLRPIPASRHRVSINCLRVGPVTKADARLDGLNIVFEYLFQAEGRLFTISGSSLLIEAGKQGGLDQIEWNGSIVSTPDIVVSTRWRWTSPIVVIEFKFEHEGQPVRVRFDAQI